MKRSHGLALAFLAGSVLAAALPSPASAAAGPVVSVKAAGSFFPAHDGFEDVFAVTLTTDEQATAHLYLRRGGTVVARGVQALDEDAPVTVTAGKGLRPGSYTWNLAITDLAGNTTVTPTKKVVADGRRIVASQETASMAVGKLRASLHAGACATARSAGAAVTLTSSLQCSAQGDGADTATASLTFPLKAGVQYGKLQVTTRSTGNNGVLSAFDGTSQHVAQAGPVQAPTATVTLPGTLVTAAHTLRLEVQTSAGEKLTLQSVTVGYVLNTLR